MAELPKLGGLSMHRHWHFGRHEHEEDGHEFGGRHAHGRGGFGRGHGRGGGGFFGRFGGPGFGGFGRGGGMRAARMLSSEDIQLVALYLLEEKPRHGYEIIKAIDEHSSGFYVPSPGVIYPALTYLEEVGFATSEASSNKKLYQITDAGKAELTAKKADAERMLARLAEIGQRVKEASERLEQDEADDEHWGGDAKRRMKREWRELHQEFHEIRHELRNALRGKIMASLEEKQRVLKVLRDAIEEIRKGVKPDEK